MGWGNGASQITVERKRHAREVQRLAARIAELETENALLSSAAYHPSACAFWRQQTCDCGVVRSPSAPFGDAS